MATSEDKTIKLSGRAYERLSRATRRGEDLSDVIIRLTETKLTGLQRRGEMEILTSDGTKVIVKIEQDDCLGAESCVSLAPMVFALDESQLGFGRKDEEPLGMKDVEERTVDSEIIILAARSCPYKAIHVKDGLTGEEIV